MKYYTVENSNKSVNKVFTIYYICMATFCALQVIVSLTGIFNHGIWGDIASTLVIQVLVLLVLPFLLYMWLLKAKPKQIFEHCNFSKINITVVLISLVLGVLAFFINIAVSSLFNGMLTFSGYRFAGGGAGDTDYSVGNFFLQVFLVAVCPAICEEFLHRGILLQGIKHIGFRKAILISSILFGLLHFNIRQVAYATVIGLLMGFISVVAKNIYPAIIVHFVNNFISTYLDFASANKWVFGDWLEKLQTLLISGNSVVIFIVSGLVMIGVVALLCLFIWLLYKQTIIRKVDKALDKAYDSFSVFSRNRPIRVEEQEVIVELLENNTLLNLDIKPLENPIDVVMPKEKSRYKTSFRDNIFMWSAVFLGAIITLFTYIWGLF